MSEIPGENVQPHPSSAYGIAGVGIGAILLGVLITLSSNWEVLGSFGRSIALVLPVLLLGLMAYIWRKNGVLTPIAQVTELLAVVLAPVAAAIVLYEWRVEPFIINDTVTVSTVLFLLLTTIVVAVFLSARRKTLLDAVVAVFAVAATQIALLPDISDVFLGSMFLWLVPVLVLMVLIVQIKRTTAAIPLLVFPAIAIPAVLGITVFRFMVDLSQRITDGTTAAIVLTSIYAVITVLVFFFQGMAPRLFVELTGKGVRELQTAFYIVYVTISLFFLALAPLSIGDNTIYMALVALIGGILLFATHVRHANVLITIIAAAQMAAAVLSMLESIDTFVIITILTLGGIGLLLVAARRLLAEQGESQSLALPLDYLRVSSDEYAFRSIYRTEYLGIARGSTVAFVICSVPCVLAIVGYLSFSGY